MKLPTLARDPGTTGKIFETTTTTYGWWFRTPANHLWVGIKNLVNNGISTTNLNWWVEPGFLVAINSRLQLHPFPLLITWRYRTCRARSTRAGGHLRGTYEDAVVGGTGKVGHVLHLGKTCWKDRKKPRAEVGNPTSFAGGFFLLLLRIPVWPGPMDGFERTWYFAGVYRSLKYSFLRGKSDS